MCIYSTSLCVSFEVLEPLDSYLFGCPTVVINNDSPISWDISFLVPDREVVLPSKDKKGAGSSSQQR
jgi:hypothetical protein